MTLYDIKTINGKKQRFWNTGRCRGIEDYSKRLGDFSEEIREATEKRKVRVLDIGCGYGNILEPRWNLGLIRKFGLAEKIFTKAEIDKNLPKLYIGESSKGLPYPSNYFDFIISVASMQYVPDKAKLLEECNRVLRKDGICRIQHSFSKTSLPLEYKNLFEIWNNKGERTDWQEYLKRFKNIQFKVTNKEHGEYIILRKAKNFKIGLELISSLDINQINPTWWGTKAVYRII